jgi:CRP-like cAMP-binding protein
MLRVQRVAAARALGPGAVLIAQGQVPDGLYLVLEGELGAYRDGQRIGTLQAGDPCGEYALVNVPSITTVRAEVQTNVLEFPHREIQGLVKSDATIAAKLAFAALARLSSRMQGLASSLARYRSWERGG